MKNNDFYKKQVNELYNELKTNSNGLTEEEVNKRLNEYGENKLTEKKRKSSWFFIKFIVHQHYL